MEKEEYIEKYSKFFVEITGFEKHHAEEAARLSYDHLIYEGEDLQPEVDAKQDIRDMLG